MMSQCMNLKQCRSASRTCAYRKKAALFVRAQASGTCLTKFKIHRHVDYGQCVQLIGNAAELGCWDSSKAIGLSWSEGDFWTANLPINAGASLEYKYVIKRKEGLDWCPGSNKSVVVPSAEAIEVKDTWDNAPSSVTVLTPAAPAEAPEAVSDSAPAPELITPVVVEAASVEVVVPQMDTEALAAALAAANDDPPLEALAPAEQPITVSTVENIVLEELTELLKPLPDATTAAAADAARDAPAPASASSGHTLTANNIVQAGPGMSAYSLGHGAAAGNGADGPAADTYEVRYTLSDTASPGGAVAVAAAPVETATATAAPTAFTATAAATAAPVKAANPKARWDGKTVAELKTELRRRGQSTFGTRRELVQRLVESGSP